MINYTQFRPTLEFVKWHFYGDCIVWMVWARFTSSDPFNKLSRLFCRLRLCVAAADAAVAFCVCLLYFSLYYDSNGNKSRLIFELAIWSALILLILPFWTHSNIWLIRSCVLVLMLTIIKISVACLACQLTWHYGNFSPLMSEMWMWNIYWTILQVFNRLYRKKTAKTKNTHKIISVRKCVSFLTFRPINDFCTATIRYGVTITTTTTNKKSA